MITDRSFHSLIVPDCTKSKNRYNYFQHPFDCSKYYKCDKSTLVEKDCAPGKIWSQENATCENDSACSSFAASVKTTFKAESDSSGDYSVEADVIGRRHGNMKSECDHKEHDLDGKKESLRKYAGFFDDVSVSA